MTNKISNRDFQAQMRNGVQTNDAATLERLRNAGVDGRKLLQDADLNRDGTVRGTNEADALFRAIDDHDRDGSRSTVTGAKPRAIISALRAPELPAPAGSTDDLYAPDANGATLAKGANGPEVRSAQQQLVRAGYELPRFGADGDFGSETERAVRAFQQDNRLDVSGQLDAPTLQALATARPREASSVQFPEYDRMFRDGVMQTTIGVGFDEAGHDLPARRTILEGLQQRGFERLDARNMTDAQLRERGFDPSTIDREATYYTRNFQHEGQDVRALVRVVDRNTPNARDQFAQGMRRDDLVLYSGHGRRGAGPDFDHANSADGNYVIGRPYEDGHYQLGRNNVRQEGALSNDYQLMMFNGCNTNLYFDDLRSVRNKDAGNLDIVGSRRELYWDKVATNSLMMLDGVMGGRSIQDIQAGLETYNADARHPGSAFQTDGFARNQQRPDA